MGKQKWTVEQFLLAIPKTGGIVSTIAQRVGCSWNTARKFIDAHPTVLLAYRDECESVLDMAESKLITAMNEGEIESVKWYLARKGKGRGYSERQEHSGPDGGSIKIDFGSLSEEQLERIRNGESPAGVLSTTRRSGARTETPEGSE